MSLAVALGMLRHTILIAAMIACAAPDEADAACTSAGTTTTTSTANVVLDQLSWSGTGCPTHNDITMNIVSPGHAFWRGNDDHGHSVLAYYNTSSSNGYLLVFMPGNPSSTRAYTAFAERAAAAGYHVIVLPIWNADENDTDPTIDPANAGHNLGSKPEYCNVTTFTAPQSHDDCFTQLRQYLWDGTPFTDYLGYDLYSPPGGGGGDMADGMQHRLRVTLDFLDAKFGTTQSWSAWRAGSFGIRWDNIVLAGHSMGAAEAVTVARYANWSGTGVHRVIMLEGPNEFYGGLTTPTSPATIAIGYAPASVFYAFNHKLDPLWPAAKHNLDTLGIGTSGANGFKVDGASFAGATAHRLYSEVSPGGSCTPHNSTGANCGASSYSLAWDYLLAP